MTVTALTQCGEGGGGGGGYIQESKDLNDDLILKMAPLLFGKGKKKCPPSLRKNYTEPDERTQFIADQIQTPRRCIWSGKRDTILSGRGTGPPPVEDIFHLIKK